MFCNKCKEKLKVIVETTTEKGELLKAYQCDKCKKVIQKTTERNIAVN